jgi:hypothetical protein
MTESEVEHIDAFAQTLNDIGSRVEREHSEREVELIFLNQGFFRSLGYEHVGNHLRSEFTLPSQKKVDFVTSGKSDNYRDSQTIVYEFKSPDKSLIKYQSQLFDYMTEISADYGVLTNGTRMRLYSNSPKGPESVYTPIELESADVDDASVLITPLSYLSIEEKNLKSDAAYAAEEVIKAIPPKVQIDYTEEQLNTFAQHFSKFLREKYQRQREHN